jgi:hypothetical protein
MLAPPKARGHQQSPLLSSVPYWGVVEDFSCDRAYASCTTHMLTLDQLSPVSSTLASCVELAFVLVLSAFDYTAQPVKT